MAREGCGDSRGSNKKAQGSFTLVSAESFPMKMFWFAISTEAAYLPFKDG